MPDVVITGLNKVDVKIHNVTYISILLQSHSCLSIIHPLYSPQSNFVKNVYFEKHENTLSKPLISSCDPSWKSCLCGCRNSDKSSRATAKKCKDEKPCPILLLFCISISMSKPIPKHAGDQVVHCNVIKSCSFLCVIVLLDREVSEEFELYLPSSH